jgi:hypothetical protein
LYELGSGAHYWYTAPSGTAGNAISFTQAMTLDASGNLGVGTSSPQAYSGFTVVTVDGATNGGVVSVRKAGTSLLNLYTETGFGVVEGVGTGTGLIFKANNAERARIDSSGNLLIGTTSSNPSGATGGSAFLALSDDRRLLRLTTSTASARDLAQFFNSNGQVGSISTSGSATTYATSSDYRLKNTIAPMTGALDRVAALKPCTYKWNADGSDGEGFIAHELQAVCPDAVTGEKDAVDEDGKPKYQGIDTSFLTATITAALQELHEIVKSQATEIAELKARLQ